MRACARGARTHAHTHTHTHTHTNACMHTSACARTHAHAGRQTDTHTCIDTRGVCCNERERARARESAGRVEREKARETKRERWTGLHEGDDVTELTVLGLVSLSYPKSH